MRACVRACARVSATHEKVIHPRMHTHIQTYLTGSWACISIGRTDDCPEVRAMTNLCTRSLRRMLTMLSCVVVVVVEMVEMFVLMFFHAV